MNKEFLNILLLIYCIFRRTIKNRRNINSLEERQRFFLQYRQSYLLVNLANYCFQSHFWPTIEFMGGVSLITILYVLLMFHSLLPFFGVLCVGSLAVVIFIVCWSMLHKGGGFDENYKTS